MKVLFLDVDGVLNSDAYFQVHPRSSRPSDMAQQLDPMACALLNDVLAATSAKIVLSSDWRFKIDSVEHMERLLRSRGALCAEIVGQTPDLVRRCRDEGLGFRLRWLSEQVSAGRELSDIKAWPWAGRGDEIVAWLKDADRVAKYAVVDDEDAGMREAVARLVHTDPSVGLTQDNADALVSLLNG